MRAHATLGATLILSIAGFAVGATNVVELDALTVSPEPGESRLPDGSMSAVVLDADRLADAGGADLQDVLALSPSLTWAGGTSRPRYFQMRGVGERSQFAGEGPPNFSVGFLIDDMDFSGIGMHGSLFDVDRVEILRGPQAAIYGSKALAGLISITTREPGPTAEGRLLLSVGTDDLIGFGIAAGGPVTGAPDVLSVRAAFAYTGVNGFRDNVALGRDDTNAREEWTGRFRVRWEPARDWRWDLTALYALADNGYDEWTPDNNGFDTYTDEPGRDRQESRGASLRGTWQGPRDFRVLSIASFVDTDIEYRYDADWGNDAFWAAPPYGWDPAVEGYRYAYTDKLLRTRRNATQDFRLISEPGGEILWGSSAWHLGVFGSVLSEKDDYDGFGILRSDYKAVSGAGYGQLATRLSDRTILRSSLRVEERGTDYHDDQGVRFDGNDTMWGGRVALERKLTTEALAFAAVSRGFKGGGVNQNPALPPDRRAYDPETIWNFEAGARASAFDGRTQGALTLFAMLRDDLQIGTSSQSDPADPTAFAYFTDNAAEGCNLGLEIEATQRMTSYWDLFGTLALLETSFKNYEAAGGVNNIEGRDQPYAPRYSFTAGTEVRIPGGFFVRAETEGRDSFYLSDSHDYRSDPYALLHLRAGHRNERLTVTLWGRNVLDEEYVTRGYAFGLEPPDFADKLYVAYGDPAQFGVTAELTF